MVTVAMSVILKLCVLDFIQRVTRKDSSSSSEHCSVLSTEITPGMTLTWFLVEASELIKQTLAVCIG